MRKLLWLGVYPFDPGYPTKMVVMAQARLHKPVVLRGWSCADGTPLRFWYRDGLPFAQLPVAADELRRTGSLRARFGPWPARGMHGGYLMLWRQGRWKIEAYRDGRRVGTAIVRTSAT